MSRPATIGRELITDGTTVLGINLGIGGYAEHNINSIDEYKAFVQHFNDLGYVTQLFMLSNNKDAKETIKKIKKEHKEDLKLIEKLAKKNKNTAYTQYSSLILRPHLNIYSTTVKIDNTDFIGRPALVDGEYVLLSIEGETSRGGLKQFIDKLDTKTISEDKIFKSSDYKNSMWTKSDYILASWATHLDYIVIAMHKGLYREYIEDIKRTLKNGYLALGYNIFNKQGLSLLFMDRICLGKDIR